MRKKVLGILFGTMILLSAVTCKNRKSESLIALGKKLFYENQLSFNETKSCASCHDPKFAFTDSYKKSIGAEGEMHQRNSRPLFNLADNYYLTSADSTLHSIATQMLNPMLRTNPRELGIKGIEQKIIEKLVTIDYYKKAFAANFKGEKIELSHIQKAIAAYVASLKSYNSKYDAFIAGDKSSFNTDEKAGYDLFFSKKTNCFNCHGGNDFDTPQNEFKNDFYYNTGLYNTNEPLQYPNSDLGLYELTQNKTDIGKFRVPTLRNLIFTAPYYHDGSEMKLTNIISYYNEGGRLIKESINKGDGALHPQKHPTIKNLNLTEIEQKNLLLFLYTLTDSTITNQ